MTCRKFSELVRVDIQRQHSSSKISGLSSFDPVLVILATPPLSLSLGKMAKMRSSA